MPTPALHPDVILAKHETLHRWKDTETGRRETLEGWKARRLEDGALFLSVEVQGPNPDRALHRFADRQASYLANRRHQPGDQIPQLDVTVPGRVAVVWRTGGVWVELWHPDTATAPVAPVEPRPLARRATPALLGGRLPFTRRKTATTA
jgi:hypothetical protein